jgi:hypothetical protein
MAKIYKDKDKEYKNIRDKTTIIQNGEKMKRHKCRMIE